MKSPSRGRYVASISPANNQHITRYIANKRPAYRQQTEKGEQKKN